MTYRSVFENRLECVLEVPAEDVLGFEAAAACAEADDKVFLIAPTVAALAAEALVSRVLVLRLRRRLDAGTLPGLDWLDAAVDVELHEWSLGKRCVGQNCFWHFYIKVSNDKSLLGRRMRTSHRIGENKTLPHLARAQVGVDFLTARPNITEHSLLKCSSILALGSCPTLMATGSLHRGPRIRWL